MKLFKDKTPKVEPVKPEVAVKPAPEVHYSVGVNTEGDTALMLHYGSGTTTLTLDAAGTRQLISMLQASINEQ